jgi:hypothetical protein
MKVKEIGDIVMNFDLSKLEQPVTVIVYTYIGVLLVTFIAVIVFLIYFLRGK